MNWVDLIILTIVALFAFQGQRRGFFVQAFDIIGLAISLLLSLFLYSFPAAFLNHFFNLPVIVANPVGFLIVWIVSETIFFALTSKPFGRFISKYIKSPINKFFGFAPAVINSLLFLSFLLLFIVSLPISPQIKKDIFDSKIGSNLVDAATSLERPFDSIFGPITKQSLTFLTVKPEEKGSLALQFTQDKLTTDPKSEQEMFNLVNQARMVQGIKPLIWDDNLQKVARMHSEDMFRRGYFSHYSPEGKDVGDRLESAQIPYTFAGENLAMAPDVKRAHEGLMNSEGHRRNILDPAFKKVGIGIVDGGIYGEMFTQVFTN